MKLTNEQKAEVTKLIVDETNRMICHTTLSDMWATLDDMPKLPDECNEAYNTTLGLIETMMQQLTNEPCFDDVFDVIEKPE